MRTDAEDYTAVSEQWLLFGLTAILVSTKNILQTFEIKFLSNQTA